MAITPRHKTNKTLLIKIANMPFGQEQELREALVNYWSTLGKVIDAQPYKFPGRPWLTKRWDIILQLPDGIKSLKAPPIFRLHGYTDSLISSWNGAPKACLHCKIAGHSTSKCPTKKPGNQKVGESANPLPKIDSADRDRKGKTKGSEVSQGYTKTSMASTSTSATATKPAIAATPATVAQPTKAPSSGFTLEVSPPPTTAETSAVPTSSSASAGSEKERILVMPRTTTPPPTQSLPDPDMPRKGHKCMSKAEDWPLTKNVLYNYLERQLICVKCWTQGHSTYDCKSGLPVPNLEDIPRHPGFQPFLQRWMLGRKKRGSPWRLDHDDVAGNPGPEYCDRCEELGHTEETCPAIVKCLHCGGAHESIGCTVNPFAVLGEDEHMEDS